MHTTEGTRLKWIYILSFWCGNEMCGVKKQTYTRDRQKLRERERERTWLKEREGDLQRKKIEIVPDELNCLFKCVNETALFLLDVQNVAKRFNNFIDAQILNWIHINFHIIGYWHAFFPFEIDSTAK